MEAARKAGIERVKQITPDPKYAQIINRIEKQYSGAEQQKSVNREKLDKNIGIFDEKLKKKGTQAATKEELNKKIAKAKALKDLIPSDYLEEAPVLDSEEELGPEDTGTHPELRGLGDLEEEIKELEEQEKKCKEQCKLLKLQIDNIKAEHPYPYELNHKANLLELLEKIVLAPTAEWKQQIINLVNISAALSAKAKLRGPDYFEALFQLSFYLNLFTDISPKKQFRQKNGKDEKDITAEFLKITTIESSGGAQHGISDITFEIGSKGKVIKPSVSYKCGEKPVYEINNRKKYFISVKRYAKEKSPRYYDVAPIYTFIKKSCPCIKEKSFAIAVCCKNRREFLIRMNKSQSEYITKSINKIYGFDYVYGKDDETAKYSLLNVLEKYRNQCFSNMGSDKPTEKQIHDWVYTNYELKIAKHEKDIIFNKLPLSLYFHQELIVNSVINRISEQAENKNYLCIGVLPRGGKSYIAGGIINKVLSTHNPEKRFWILFITSAVNETASQFKEDLIEKFKDYDSFDFIHLTNAKKSETPYKAKIESKDPSIKPNTFVFVSRELFTQKIMDTQNYSAIFNRLGYGDSEKIDFSLVFFDEAHKGGIKPNTRSAIQKHISGKPPFILMTATYKKLLDEKYGYIDKQNDLFIWDLDDVRLLRRLPDLGLENFKKGFTDAQGQSQQFNLYYRYDEYLVNSLIQRRLDLGETYDSIVEPYNKFPDPYFLSATFTPAAIEKLKVHQAEGGISGFSLQNHFSLYKDTLDKDGKQVISCEKIKALLDDHTQVKNWYKALKYPEEAIALRSFLTPNDDGESNYEDLVSEASKVIKPGFNEDDKIFNRIFAITKQEMGLDARPRQGVPHSILMFLPTGSPGEKIGATCRAWASLLLQTNYWAKNFIILGLSEYHYECKKTEEQEMGAEGTQEAGTYELFYIGGKPEKDIAPPCLEKGTSPPRLASGSSKTTGYCSIEKLSGNDLKEKIISIERAALEENKGLVILTGDRAKMGISLPCVDVVCLFDNNSEADDIIQKMYRALTDSPGKKKGFIVDLNPKRIIKAKFEYIMERNKSQSKGPKLSDSEMIDDIIKSNMWDSDAWIIKREKDTDEKRDFHTFMQQIKDDLLDGTEKDILKLYEKETESKDIFLMGEDKDFKANYAQILEYLGDSKPKRTGRKREQGPEGEAILAPVPKEASERGAGAEPGEEKEEPPPQPQDLESKKRQLAMLTRHFVNILVIRNKEALGSEVKTLKELLKIYEKSKEEAIKEKYLEKDAEARLSSCDVKNLYFRVFKDIINFVDLPKYNSEGIIYVGKSSEKERLEDYAKLPSGAILYVGRRKHGDPVIAIYNSSSRMSLNTWATNVFKTTTNIWDAVEIADSDNTTILQTKDFSTAKISLRKYIEKYPESKPIDISPKLKPTKDILDIIQARFTDEDVDNLYVNYIESFIRNMDDTAIEINYLGQKGGTISSDKRYNEVLETIDKYLIPDKTAKDSRGEVFTPPKLVRQMLFGISKKELAKGKTVIWGYDKDSKTFIDADEEDRCGGLPTKVWENPLLTWLDPANGIGNFPIIAFYKLDYCLSKVKGYEDSDTRREHIIKNMLFMMELDESNNETCKGIFSKIYKGVKPNILCCDSLEISYDEINKKFGRHTFNVIIGNPPFNAPKTETGSNGNPIWQNFVIKSNSMLEDKGYLVLVHPPGWKKPTDDKFKSEIFEDGVHYKYEAKSEKHSIKQIRQGQIWQVLKDSGVFKFIYTNDQRSKSVGKEYLEYFPAVDYYVYQKGGEKTGCDTKNIFFGNIIGSSSVKLNLELPYLPSLITKQTQDILHKISSKEGNKLNFSRGIDERGISWSGKSIDWLYDSNKIGFQYKKHGKEAMQKSGPAKDTVNIDKVVINFGGGINSYNVKYISKTEEVGVLDKTMYSEVDAAEGKIIEDFFKSDIVKFIFLITQYASGAITQNEPLVANSITIPPKGITDYYKFFFEDKAEEYKTYVEKTLDDYNKSSAPKNTTRKANKPENGTRKCPKTSEEPHPISGECVPKCRGKKTRNAKGDCVKPTKAGSRTTRKFKRS